MSGFGKTLLLGLAYAATVGGMATPIGTLPNLVLIQILKIRFPAAPEVGFGRWVRCVGVLACYPSSFCFLSSP